MAAVTKEQILDAIAEMKITEIADLIKAMEEKFGVTAAAPVAVAAAGGPAAAAEEKTEFTVVLKAGVPADKKIAIIKEVRAITGLGLKEAKDLVESAPKVVVENAKKEDAEKAKAALEAEGATVTLK